MNGTGIWARGNSPQVELRWSASASSPARGIFHSFVNVARFFKNLFASLKRKARREHLRALFAQVSGCILIAAASLDAAASENIRVAIMDNQKTVILEAGAGLIAANDRTGVAKKKMAFTAAAHADPQVRVSAVDGSMRVNGKSYRGVVEIRRKASGLFLVVNELDIEEYLRGVIAAEVPPDWEFEALKAQAVASRTYALYQKKAAGKRPYHILATVNGQVYDGRRGEHSNTLRAVRETAGMVLLYRGAVIPAFYHSSCGGHTENASELWGIDAPYLRGVDCDCQTISKYGTWEKRISISRIEQSLDDHGYAIKDIQDMEINGITPAGRVRLVAIRHRKGVTDIPAETLRAAAGYSVLPSSFFELGLEDNEVVFSGRGMGHGVGLCQWGAQERAGRGFDYRSILGWYYPGTTLARMEEL